jgi:hypothetical protein
MNKEQGIFPSLIGDKLFIFFIPLVAILSATFVSVYPQYFSLVLALDLWLLGYHHVISTFSRIGFDQKNIIENWKLLFPLPLLVFISVYSTYTLGGGILIGSLYLYWQWYHYTRQSEGISKAYGMKSGSKNFVNNPFNRAAFYFVPLFSFIYMLGKGDDKFLGIPIFTIPLTPEFRSLLLILSCSIALIWILLALKSLYNKSISLIYFCYMLSHFIIYIYSYLFIDNINFSWLSINIWHNAQYIFFVWLFNRKKYSSGVSSEHIIISYLSQPGRIWIYIGSFICLTSLIYHQLEFAVDVLAESTDIPLIILVYSTINFHHYIVDSQIWKLKSQKLRSNIVNSIT